MENTKNILVAEDNESNFLLVKAILRHHTMIRAVNGLEAVQLAAKKDFDVILMDIKMPEMDGLEATRLIRASGNKTPIIAISANAFDLDRKIALAAGCDAYISKPLNARVLKQALEGGGGKPFCPLSSSKGMSWGKMKG
ncbi:MAG: response regulator [Bacteroidaceae bacterium]